MKRFTFREKELINYAFWSIIIIAISTLVFFENKEENIFEKQIEAGMLKHISVINFERKIFSESEITLSTGEQIKFSLGSKGHRRKMRHYWDDISSQFYISNDKILLSFEGIFGRSIYIYQIES